MIGREFCRDDELSFLERLYIGIFGIPINGLRTRARRVLPFLAGKRGRILDAGCGQGVFTMEIARRNPDAQVTGIDISTELIERNQRLLAKVKLPNADFRIMDILNLQFDDPFDLVVSVDNIEHIDDDDAALAQFRRVLKSGGELILHVPCLFRRWFFMKWTRNFDVEGHFRPGYTMGQIVRKLEKAGFSVVENHHTFGWCETVSNNISYSITKARMKRKILYALAFPFLEFLSWLGRNSRPAMGAGILIRAKRRS